MASDQEQAHILSMSRKSVVEAYTRWAALSDEEALIVSGYIADGSRVLDLGCGAGRLVPVLREKGCTYLGVDASPQMIDAARVRHPDVAFEVGNLVDFAFEAGDHDAVLLMHNVIDSLHPVERRRAFLRSCRDRLGEGRLILSSHVSDTEPGYVLEDYHGASVETFHARHSWHVTELESLGYQVLMSIQCERDGQYDWCYFVATPIRSVEPQQSR